MTPELKAEINQMIQDGFTSFGQGQQYGVSNVGFHTHNGLDSPVLKTPVTSYVGYIGSDGSTGQIFPKGWIVSYSNVGGVNPQYTIVHNLGNSNYTVSAISYSKAYIPILYSLDDNSSPDYGKYSKQVTLRWSDTSGTIQQNSFQFAIILGQTTVNLN